MSSRQENVRNESSLNSGIFLADFMDEMGFQNLVQATIYATIFGFWKSGKSYYGSLSYLAKKTYSSKQTVITHINWLVE